MASGGYNWILQHLRSQCKEHGSLQIFLIRNMNRLMGSSDDSVTCYGFVKRFPFPAGKDFLFCRSIHICCEPQPVGKLTRGGLDGWVECGPGNVTRQ